MDYVLRLNAAEFYSLRYLVGQSIHEILESLNDSSIYLSNARRRDLSSIVDDLDRVLSKMDDIIIGGDGHE